MRAGAALSAAGIADPRLRAGYELCRRLNAVHGRTYYLATLLLPPAKRPYVHALYGFARHADDIVDDLAASAGPEERAARFSAWSRDFVDDLDWGESGDPVCRAVIDTIRRWDIPRSYFADFLDSMRMDLTVTEYATFDDLSKYTWGSAAVIGLQMLPILGRADDSVGWEALEPYAIDLGVAFQLTNFLRDVAEDLRLGRIYLPQDSLAAFGVDRELLGVLADEAAWAVERFLAAETVEVERLTKDGRKTVDARRPVVSVAVSDGGEPAGSPPRAILDVVVRLVTPAVRPDDLLAALHSVAGLALDVPRWEYRAVRLAQGPLDGSGAVGDPLAADRVTREMAP